MKRRFRALPRVPLLLLFNDADEEFPAEARILFRANAERILDMECLAILGWLLSSKLIKQAGKQTKPVTEGRLPGDARTARIACGWWLGGQKLTECGSASWSARSWAERSRATA